VSWRGPLAEGYRACLWSRVASRVLVAVAEVDARDADSLHAAVADLPWEEHFPEDATLAVDFNGISETLRNTLFAARRVKDGIVDRLRALRGARPDVDLAAPGLRIVAHLHHGRASLSLDLSGPAHRRGYRGGTGAAPLRENLAAAVLLRAGWPTLAARGAPLFDPLCGSGTLLIEGALIAAGAAPGEQRAIGSPRWRGHDSALLERLRTEAREQRLRGSAALPPISGVDRDPRVLRHAVHNIGSAGFEGGIAVQHGTLAAVAAPAGSGLLVCNPPWGERLGAGDELPGLYAELGRRIREDFSGWRAAILTLEGPLAEALELRIDRRYRLRNGPLDCCLLVHDPALGARRAVAAARRVEGSPPGRAPAAAPAAPRQAPAPADPRDPTVAAQGVAMLANRLRKNQRRLRGWLASAAPQCYRVYDADIPEYAVAVDRYADWLHVAEYAPPASVDPALARARLADVRSALVTVFGVPPERIVLKTRERQRGTRQYQRLGNAQHFIEVREGSARLLVNLHDYLDTGLFLDHRPARRLIARLAPGKRFLNLFCYTASASVHAALGGASITTSVDLSATYLEWATRNLALNGLAAPAHRCERADCLRWLEEAGGEWDLVFLDPPSFSNSARMRVTLDVQRDHVVLLRAAMQRLAPGGILLFSTNRHGFRLDREALSGLAVEDLSEASVDPDFPRRPLPHRLYRIERGT
jgi:23S rRNA (guanine2445-N2)-methyltransferase / 23S rRNA (guanine2069-N7)-methyltransferase